ncbi:hypothetical protein GCM10020229_52470 [Kitasatospora albolonga]
MNRPARIEGSAVIASTRVRTSRLNRPGTSLMKTAQLIPTGMVMASEMVIWISVPTMACSAPPLSSGSVGAGLGQVLGVEVGVAERVPALEEDVADHPDQHAEQQGGDGVHHHRGQPEIPPPEITREITPLSRPGSEAPTVRAWSRRPSAPRTKLRREL